MQTLSIPTPHGLLHAHFSCPHGAVYCAVVARTQTGMVDNLITANLEARRAAVVQVDLLNSQEARFPDAGLNVPRLTARLLEILELVSLRPELAALPLGIFASGDASPAAVRAAAQRDRQVGAIACHGGLIDRAGLQSLKLLSSPLLMLIDPAAEGARLAWQRSTTYLAVPHEMHLLGMGERPDARVAAWFSTHL